MKLKMLEAKAAMSKQVPVYIQVSGTWPDQDYNDVYGNALYVIDMPTAEAAKALVDKLNAKAFKELVSDEGIDRFEQDFMPAQADGHAHNISSGEVSLEKPAGRWGRTMHNVYTMVYFLRDHDYIGDEYAKSIATAHGEKSSAK